MRHCDESVSPGENDGMAWSSQSIRDVAHTMVEYPFLLLHPLLRLGGKVRLIELGELLSEWTGRSDRPGTTVLDEPSLLTRSLVVSFREEARRGVPKDGERSEASRMREREYRARSR